MSTNTVRNLRILVRRDDAIEWSENNPVLLKGEMGYELDERGLKFGDGFTEWKDLPYFAGGFDGIDGGGPTLNLSENATQWPWGNYGVVIG